MLKKPTAGAGSMLGNIIWLVLAGWWLALAHIVTAVFRPIQLPRRSTYPLGRRLSIGRASCLQASGRQADVTIQIERRLRTVSGRLENVRMARDAAVREAAEHGMSYRQIAEVTGLSHQRAGQIVKAASQH